MCESTGLTRQTPRRACSAGVRAAGAGGDILPRAEEQRTRSLASHLPIPAAGSALPSASPKADQVSPIPSSTALQLHCHWGGDGGGAERETPLGFREEFRGVCGVAGGERERTSLLVVAGRAAMCHAAALPSGDHAPISFLRLHAAASLGRRRERPASLLLCLCVRASSFPLSLFLFTISGRKRLCNI